MGASDIGCRVCCDKRWSTSMGHGCPNPMFGHPCGQFDRELRAQRGTRIIELPAVLRFRSSYLNGPRELTNFGIGPRVCLAFSHASDIMPGKSYDLERTGEGLVRACCQSADAVGAANFRDLPAPRRRAFRPGAGRGQPERAGARRSAETRPAAEEGRRNAICLGAGRARRQVRQRLPRMGLGQGHDRAGHRPRVRSVRTHT